MNETASRLMDLAEAHIRNAGYNGYSFRDLASEAGIKSSSVHHHFPTKGKLAAAVARRYTDRFLDFVANQIDHGTVDVVVVYRSAFRVALKRDGRMCLGGVLGAEAGGLPPEVAVETRQFFSRLIDDLARRMGGKGAKSRALRVLATLEGAMILARATGNLADFDQATAGLD